MSLYSQPAGRQTSFTTDEKSTLSKWLAATDHFRSIPHEFQQSSKAGGALTLCTYVLVAILLLAEIGSFLSTNYITVIKMDGNHDEMLRINFDIVMHDLPCKYIRLGIFDTFGERVDHKTEAFHYIPVDTDGIYKGLPVQSKDVKNIVHPPLSKEKELSKEEDKKLDEELDSDWTSSDDHFHKHDNFKAAATHHEFSLILFYADWCSHCLQFHPTWNDMVAQISLKEKFKNVNGHDVQVKLLKINCVDFQDACREERIVAYPTIKLYDQEYGKKDDNKPIPFAAQRTIANFREFLVSNIGKSAQERWTHEVQQEDAILHEGCQVRGFLTVQRVPGEFHLQANADNVGSNLDPVMTNVSHTVNHLSFGSHSAGELFSSELLTLGQLHPIDGMSFSVKEFGQAPQHYLKIVSTSMEDDKRVAYQVTHSDRISVVTDRKIPQAKFMYDMSPLSVHIRLKQKRWYEFLTSLCALLGGFYTVAKLLSRTVLVAVKKD